MFSRLMLVGLLIFLPLSALAQNEPPEFLATWPVSPPTEEQVLEARRCDLETQAEKLYADATLEILDAVENLDTACDWAILAQAYASMSGGFQDGIPEGARRAMAETLAMNPAMLVSEMLMYGYIGMGNLVEAPPLADQVITDVSISHEYSGIGSYVVYTAKISKADTESPVVRVRVTESEGVITEEGVSVEIADTVDPALVQALGAALTDLIPIETQFSTLVCYDNYPDWVVTLRFADGTDVELKTNGSNFFHFGGPWQTELDGQNYMQYSPALIVAMIDLVNAIHLPQGGTAAMSCFGFDPLPLDAAFQNVDGE